MKRMKSLKASALTVLLGMAVLCTIMFSACPNAAKGGGKSGRTYVKVPYDKLETYLANTASAAKVNYIEITGDIPIADFEGKEVDGSPEAGELGKKIKAAAPKKVALKLPGKIEGLDSMLGCFYLCTNLVSLANIPEGVTNMQACFHGCASLTQAPDIPASVTEMGACFAGCTSLTQAPDIPASVTEMRACFYGCTSLTQAPDIPASVTEMGLCFDGCTSLTKAPVIPLSVEDMERCFAGCTSLTQAPDIPASVTNMPACFSGCSALKGVKLLCNYNGTNKFTDVFKDCTALEAGGIKVKNEQYYDYIDPAALDNMAVPPIGNTAEQKGKFATIGGETPIEYVKVDYDNLRNYLKNTASADEVNYIAITGDIPVADFKGKEEGYNATAGELGKKIKAYPTKKVALKLPVEVAGLKSMGVCFYGCINLVSIANIPASVTDMGSCFYGCESLTKAPVIPAGVTNMAACFDRCKSLTESPVIPAKVTDMSWCFLNCDSLTQAPVIPESVTNMVGCFSGCTSLAQAPAIPANVTDMRWCFYDCTSLAQAPAIPANVTNMESCFSGCTSLAQAPVIPESVTNMQSCFSGCSALKGVKLHCNYNPADIGYKKAFKGLFDGCTALEKGGVKVPAAFYNNYTADEALDVMEVPPAGNPAEQKKKFSSF